MAQEGKVNRLIIENAQVSDCGRFTIQAMNAVGNKQSTCVLIVAPAPTPVPGVGPSVASVCLPFLTKNLQKGPKFNISICFVFTEKRNFYSFIPSSCRKKSQVKTVNFDLLI